MVRVRFSTRCNFDSGFGGPGGGFSNNRSTGKATTATTTKKTIPRTTKTIRQFSSCGKIDSSYFWERSLIKCGDYKHFGFYTIDCWLFPGGLEGLGRSGSLTGSISTYSGTYKCPWSQVMTKNLLGEFVLPSTVSLKQEGHDNMVHSKDEYHVGADAPLTFPFTIP